MEDGPIMIRLQPAQHFLVFLNYFSILIIENNFSSSFVRTCTSLRFPGIDV